MIDNNGEKNPFYGKHHTLETKSRLSKIAKKRKATPETCRAISEAHKGSKNHMYGKRHTEESKLKISESKKGQKTRLGTKHTEEAKAKMSAIKRGNQYSVGHVMSEQARDKLSRERKGNYLQEYWNDPEYRDRTIKAIRSAQSVKPNKPETIMQELLDDIDPANWKYTGDGGIVFGGRIPDFYNINGQKKIIEVFGDYWHGERARCYEETEEGRIEHFRKYGHDTLIIWVSELADIEKVKDKIKEFVSKGGEH